MSHNVTAALISLVLIAFVPAGAGETDPLLRVQGNWICQGGGGQLGREAAARKLGLPFWNREFRPKITMEVKGDRWTMNHPDGAAKGKLVIRSGAKLQDTDLILDGSDEVRLLGLVAFLEGGRWGMYLNLPGKARPADTVNGDLSFFWAPLK